jgi:Xaa-Pro dipeptidase
LRRRLPEAGIRRTRRRPAKDTIFYLSGQQTPGYYVFQCLGVPAEGAPFLVLRELESYNARGNSYIEDIQGYPDGVAPAAALADALKARGWQGKRIAIDRNAWYLTVNIYEGLTQQIPGLLDGSGLVEPMRRIKSSRELQSMELAAEANDAGMRAGLDATAAGASENDVAAAVLQACVAAGSEYLGMEPFVSSGPRSGMPHSTWRRRRIEPGDLVILETAAAYNRYHAALFRTVAVGRVPDLARRYYDVCLEALDAAVGKMRPGNSCADVHTATQAVVDKHGRTDNYRKRTGYSLGIAFAPDWGEGNILSLHHTVEVPLQPNMVFHVPITLREFGRFTVAVSETVVITDGGPRTLSQIPRDLVEA